MCVNRLWYYYDYYTEGVFISMSRMMPSPGSFFFFFLPEDGKSSRASCQKTSKNNICPPHMRTLSTNSNYNSTINKHRKENLLEHGLEHWRTRRKQRRRDNEWGGNKFQSTYRYPFKKLSTTENLWIFIVYFLMVRYHLLIYWYLPVFFCSYTIHLTCEHQ